MRIAFKKETDEKSLIKQCLKGNSTAQFELYNRFEAKMLGVCLRYATDRDEAQDILQNSMIKVFSKLDNYKGAGSFEGWIRRIVVNTALDHVRKRQKESLFVNQDDTQLGAEPADDMLDGLALEELLKHIQALPDGYKMVLNLYAIEGYSHKEIGQMLGINPASSASQYSRAKSMLKKRLEKSAQFGLKMKEI